MANIYVTRPKMRVNVALVYNQDDVPEFLTKVRVFDGKIYNGFCNENNELCSIGNFISWEKNPSCKGGFNVWWKRDGHSTLFWDKWEWYERAPVGEYSEINWACPEIPDFATDGPIEVCEDKIVLHTEKGDQVVKAPEPCAIIGYPDDEFVLLKLSSHLAREYRVCRERGKIIRPLIVT